MGTKEEGGTLYHRIVVPLDGSARAEKILPYVEELALQYSSEVRLLQVVEPIIEVDPTDTFVFRGGKFAAEIKNEIKGFYKTTIQSLVELPRHAGNPQHDKRTFLYGNRFSSNIAAGYTCCNSPLR